MSNWFKLTLDTTPPNLEIIAPIYTAPDIYTEITIISNEPLKEHQEIYIIDKNGVRHDVIFHYEGTQYIGLIKFNQVPQGLATIYCRLKDMVDNQSNLVSKPIRILEDINFEVNLKVYERDVSIDCFERHIEFTSKELNKCLLETTEREIEFNIKKNEITFVVTLIEEEE